MLKPRFLARAAVLAIGAPLVACGSLRSDALTADASVSSEASAQPDTGAPASDDAGQSDATLSGNAVDAGLDADASTPDADASPAPDAAQPTDAALDAGGSADAGKLACGDASYSDPWSPGYTQDPTVLANTSAMVSSMTLTEQANQMRGTSPDNNSNYDDIFRTPDDETKGVKGFLFRDGSRGLCLAAELPAGEDGYSTAFPVSAARGAAFDMDLEYQIGAGIGDETLASGNTMLLAPVLNILRHPAWGRAQESYGEDTFLIGRLGTAFTAGAQTYLPTCLRHYAAYDIEDGRATNNSELDEQTLREFYTRHFEMVVQEGGAACVLAAYNLVNGTASTLNTHLLSDILRGDMGFKGFVLSDWWALPPGTASTTTSALQATAAAGVSAGMDMELPWTYNYAQIEAITGPGLPLSAATVALSASRIIEQKYRFNVGSLGTASVGLKTPTTYLDSTTGSIANNSANIALSLRAARESMVLLKNDASTLPIPSSAKTVAVVGALVPFSVPGTTPSSGTVDFATDVRLGDLGSSRVFSDPATSVGPFAGIQAAAGGAVTVVSGSDVSVAQNADFVVVVAGLTPEDEGEEYTGAGDRATFALDGKSGTNAQNTLIGQVAALGKPMVVVLEGGSVIDMPWLDQVPAVVMAWYPGMVGGTALGQMLFGQASFSGKLPVTWPQQWSDEPPFNQGTTTQFNYYVGYHYFDQNGITPLFPFGAGLSYTTFQYANLDVPCATVTDASVVDVQADVTNTGSVAGDEITFLFVSYPSTTVRRPAKELKGFVRETVAPGQTVHVTIPLRISDLKYWDTASSSWKIEPGPVSVMVGSSSANLPLSDTLVVQ